MQRNIRHVSLIMDGNRRWAKSKGLSTRDGHKEGVEALERVVKAAAKLQIEFLTVYALSTENLKERENAELKDLFSLIRSGFVSKLPTLKREGVKVNFIGNLAKLPLAVRKTLAATEKALAVNERLVLNIAINYGSREEILKAAGSLVGKEASEAEFADRLYTANIPDPDLIVRTGGQVRLSNFLLWQGAYSELYFTDTLWPDFGEKDFEKALKEFERRKRNFGA